MTLVGGRGKESMWLHMPSLLAFCLKCFTTSFAFEHNSIQYCVVLLKMFFERTDEFVVLTNKKRIRPQALQKVGAVVAARELLYRIRCLKGQSLSRSCSTWSSQHKLGLKNRDVQNWFFFLQYINNQPSSIRRFFSLAWFLMSIRYMKNLRIIKSGIKYIIKNIYQTNLASFIPRHCVYLFIHAKVWVITYFVNKHQCKIRNAKNSKMPARTLEYLLHPALSTSRGHTILDNTFLCAPFW